MDEFRRQVGSLADGQIGPHSTGFAVGAFQHGEIEPVVAGEGRGGVGQGLRGHHIRGCRHQFTGQFNPGAGGSHRSEGCSGTVGQTDQLQGLGHPAGVRFLAEALILVESQLHGLGSAAGGVGGVQTVPGQQHTEPSVATD